MGDSPNRDAQNYQKRGTVTYGPALAQQDLIQRPAGAAAAAFQDTQQHFKQYQLIMFRNMNQVLSASSPTLPHSRSHISRSQSISLPTLLFLDSEDHTTNNTFRLNKVQCSFPSLLEHCNGFSLSGKDWTSFRKTVYTSDTTAMPSPEGYKTLQALPFWRSDEIGVSEIFRLAIS